MSDRVRAGRRTVPVTNWNKVLFPEDGITKGELIEYYLAVAPRMLAHIRGRPLTMERFPDGITSQRFYQKNISKHFPDWIPRADVPKREGTVTHVLANDAATLVYLANLATVTMHTWLSTIARPFEPDQMIFDLDPSRESFDEVRRMALAFREALTDAGLVPFVKTTGSRGLHVVVPIRRSGGFDAVHGIARAVAERVIEEHPDTLTLEWRKADRGGRIYVDLNRNAYAQTAVAPYSVRPRTGAPVAVPLHWDELEDRRMRPDGFSMRDAIARPDPWSGFRAAARTLARTARTAGADPVRRRREA